MNNELFYIESLSVNLSGFVVGLYSFFNIIIARKLCIVGEYHFSKKLWIAFLMIGLILIPLSLIQASLVVSTILGITGFTYLWGIHEIIEQEERVNKGWYPKKHKK